MPPAFEVLLLNTAIPQIQAAQSGDTYVVPRDIAFSAALTLSAGTANGVPYLNASKVLTTGSALTFDGTNFSATGTTTVNSANSSQVALVVKGETGNGIRQNFIGQTSSGQYNWQIGASITEAGNFAIIPSTAVDGTTFSTAAYAITGTGTSIWSVSGSELMRLTSTGLGIGTSSPLTKLEVNDYVNTSYTELVAFTGAKGAFVGIPTNQLSIVDSTAQAAGVGGEIVFEGKFDSSNITCFASVGGVKENSTSSDYGGAFVVRTRVNGGNLTERARISSDGTFRVKGAGTAGTTDAVQFSGSAPASAMTLDASGDWVVGGTTPDVFGTGFQRNATVVASGATASVNISGANASRIQFGVGSTRYGIIYQDASNFMQIGTTTALPISFNTNSTERARITSAGYFKASNAGTYYNSGGSQHELRNSVADADLAIFTHTSATNPYGVYLQFTAASPDNNTNYFLTCADSTTNRCIIYSDGDLANHDGVYGTISDQKLKQDIVDAGSQWNDIKAIRFRKYRMKSDVAANPDAPALLGVVAQELEQVSPGLVDEHPDMETVEVTDEDGNVTQTQQPTGTTTKTVKSSILLMKAAVALQEAMARIEKLEAEVAELKGA